MSNFYEKSGFCRKILCLFLCGILILGTFTIFVGAAEDDNVSEFFVGNNREEINLNGMWKWGLTEFSQESLPEILPENTVYDKELNIPSYTLINDEASQKEKAYLWYEKVFSLANRPGESVVVDLGTDCAGIAAVYVNNMKAESDNISAYLKTGKNRLIIVREYSAESSNKFHFTDEIKLIFSNSPVITFADITTDVVNGTISFEIGLYNPRETALKTNVTVTILDKESQNKGFYEHKDVDVLKNSKTSVTVTGVKVENFSEKTKWSEGKPYVYTAKISVAGDTVYVPFGMLPDKLFGTEGYRYGMDIVVSDFFANVKNNGYTWNKDWVTALFKYFKDIDWNVITYRDGMLPKVWHEVALKEGILLIDKNDDSQWSDSQKAIWTVDTDFISKASDIKSKTPESLIIPIVYKDTVEGLFNNSPEFSGVSKIRLQNLFKASAVQNNTTDNAEEKGFFSGIISYFKEMLNKTFVKDNRYQLFLTGLGNTLLVAAAATLCGVFIGIIIAVIKVVHHQSVLSKKKNMILNILNLIAEAYTAIIRGTPVVVQLLITYNVIFVFSDEAVLIGIFAFSINSGAYISEIIRAGINSVDKGQTEAGRSLGLSQFTTMKSIVLPQALKNILPALGNEFIALLKETSVIGYLGVVDLTRAGELVRSRTADAFFTLIFVAVVYFILVFGLTALFKYFERRLSKSDKN